MTRVDDDREPAAPDYPAGWEADVVLHDGSTTHVRPIRASDADALQAFHVGQSARSTYLRFFAPLERLSDRDLHRLVTVDHDERVALVAVSGEDERIIGVARYDRITPDEAEVAFNVSDAHQGRGLGSVLLEHLAAAARERGVRRFVAEVLPANGRMIAVFRDAGYEVRSKTQDGVVAVGFDIDPTDRSLAVMADREHRAESRSMHALLGARSVVVVGPGPQGAGTLPGRAASAAYAHLVTSDPTLVVHAVGVHDAPSVALADVPAPVDLAVVAVAEEHALDLVRALVPLGARGVVLLSGGFAEHGAEGLARQRAVLRVAHATGMRIVGPASFGIVATRPDGGPLNASLARRVPPPGPVGLFCQSAPLSVPLLEAMHARGLGLSEFVSAGHRADVSGNDLMQFWADDDRTQVVGLYLESIGNPRKFTRVARRLAATKPVVVLTAGRSGQVVPPGHAVRATLAPPRTLHEVLRQSGVIRVDNTHQLLDVVQLLAHQPLPAGRRVGILASSPSVAALVAEAAAADGLVVSGRVGVLPEDADAAATRAAVDAVYGDPEVDVVVAVRIPTVGGPNPALAGTVALAAADSGKTSVVCIPGLHGRTAELTAAGRDGTEHTVPAYTTPEDATAALGHAARYARWRTQERGLPVHPDGVDTRAARRLVAQWLADSSGTADAVVPLDASRTAELLACAGVHVLPSIPVHDGDEAAAAAVSVGWPVALKTTVPALRHRADLGGVRLDLGGEDELRAAVAQVLALTEGHRDEPGAPLEVQAMAPHGIPCVVRSVEDPLFGPLISFGLGGDASDLLGDVSYRVPPLTDVDVSELVRSPRAAPRLFGYRGLPALDVAALEDVVARVAVLADDLPELRSLELNPVAVAERGAVVLGARATLARADRVDVTRRLARP